MTISADELRALANFYPTVFADLKNKLLPAVDTGVTGLEQAQGAVEVILPFLLPNAATTTYTFTVPDKMEIIDVTCIKDAAGAANTVQLTNGADTAISDAIAAAVDKTVTRAGTLDKATRVLASGATLKLVNTRAAGSSACAVFVKCIVRPA